MPAGRPSKYTDEMPERLLKLMAEGFSPTAAAGALGVCKQTINNWAAEHPEFLAALKEGRSARLFKLENDLLTGPKDGPFVTSRIFALKNADRDEWGDRKEVDVRSGDGSMTPKALDLSALPTDVLRSIVASAETDEGDDDEGIG